MKTWFYSLNLSYFLMMTLWFFLISRHKFNFSQTSKWLHCHVWNVISMWSVPIHGSLFRYICNLEKLVLIQFKLKDFVFPGFHFHCPSESCASREIEMGRMWKIDRSQPFLNVLLFPKIKKDGKKIKYNFQALTSHNSLFERIDFEPVCDFKIGILHNAQIWNQRRQVHNSRLWKTKIGK